MPRRALALRLTLLCSLGGGCDLDAPVGTSPETSGGDPGSGTGALLVQALIEAEATDNASDPSQFETEIKIRVSRQGSPVQGATVKVGVGSVVLVLGPSEAGTYTASRSGYFQSCALDVLAGADSVTGVRLSGPAAHTFSSPGAGTVHTAGQALEVRWAPTGAGEAVIATDQLPSTKVTDTGAYTVPGTYLKPDPGQDEADRVRLARTRRISLAGGAPGSTLAVSVRNEVEFRVRQN